MSLRRILNRLPVPARRLRHRPVCAQDGLASHACLFPFFDRWGKVVRVMLLTAEGGRIRLFPWQPGLLCVPTWGPVGLAGRLASLQEITPGDAEAAGTLWHYDPWWMLDDARYRGHGAVPLLKATNCADQIKRGHGVVAVYFRRDLARLTWVAVKDRGGIRMKRWQSDLLPAGVVRSPGGGSAMAAGAPSIPPAGGGGHRSGPVWRFDPIWSRWTAP